MCNTYISKQTFSHFNIIKHTFHTHTHTHTCQTLSLSHTHTHTHVSNTQYPMCNTQRAIYWFWSWGCPINKGAIRNRTSHSFWVFSTLFGEATNEISTKNRNSKLVYELSLLPIFHIFPPIFPFFTFSLLYARPSAPKNTHTHTQTHTHTHTLLRTHTHTRTHTHLYRNKPSQPPPPYHTH